jgi:hypothetical protein
VAAAIAVLAVVPAAFFYAWGTSLAPGPVNVIALLVFGGWIALVVDRVVRLGHVRNRAWVTWCAIALTLCAWYCQWVAWLAFAAQRREGGAFVQYVALLAGDPGALLAAAMDVAHEHARAVTMVCIWVLEALILLCCAPWPGRARTAQPYCDASGAWADELPVPWDFASSADTVAATRLLEQAPHQLLSLLAPLAERDAPDGADYTRVTLYRCRGSDAFVSIAGVYYTAGTPEASIYHEEEWLTLLRLPDTDADMLTAQLLPQPGQN